MFIFYAILLILFLIYGAYLFICAIHHLKTKKMNRELNAFKGIKLEHARETRLKRERLERTNNIEKHEEGKNT
ncbi:hypothetical protein GQU05_004498 [Salmonella enterica]|nr:hypothetical protein [Salmonella enterica]